MIVAQESEFRIIGKGVTRPDAEDKVRGRAQYADDVPAANAWHGVVIRSPISHGRLTGLRLDPTFDWSSVVVVTPEDIPGTNIVDMMGRDMPFLAFDEIQYRGEPLALVAAPTREQALAAAACMHADIDPLPPLLTLDEMVRTYKTKRTDLKELWAQTIRKGDVEAALSRADHVVEREYAAGHQEQLYIEPQGMIVTPESDGSLFIHGSMQCPYYIQTELSETLNIPREKLRVKQSAVGGAFGGKEEFPTLIAGYCALLALKAQRPVKIIYDRSQDMLFTTKRHPSWTRYRAGVRKDGTLCGIHAEFLLDGGAYTTLSPVVLFRGILHTAMGYRCDDVFIDGHVYRTNTFPNGAFRGFGAPQALWALESLIDELAAACGMTPDAFRLKNALHQGDTTPTGGVLRDSVGSPFVLEKTLERSRFAEKFARCSRGRPEDAVWKGVGLSFFAHGAGFTGDGEAQIKAKAALDLELDDLGAPIVNVRVSSTEMGQGTCAILPQVTAEGLSIALEHVKFPLPDTAFVPDSGPTVASRTAMVVGSTLFNAAQKMKTILETFASETFYNGQPVTLEDDEFFGVIDGVSRPFTGVARLYLKEKGSLRVNDEFKLAEYMCWNQTTFVGDAYPSYSWGCNVAEVDVDPLTCEIRVRKVTAYFDIGRVLNPVLAKGQLEGGLVQALGYAVMEKMGINKDGLYDANRMQTYLVPTALDIPEMDLHFMEFPYDHAQPGAKGVGELPMDGLAPAIANAVEQATGVRIRDLPITPEKLFECLHGTSKGAR